MFWLLVIERCVSDIVVIGTVNFVFIDHLFTAVFFLCLRVKHFACGERPCVQVTVSIKSSKEAVLFSPNEVVVLVAHTNTVDKIQVGEWDHRDRVEVLNERESITELAIVDEIRNSTDSLRQLVLFNFALE